MRKFTLPLTLITALILIAAAPVFTTDRVQAQDTTKMKVGLLPILDVLPFYVAEEAGYFADAGLDVELIPVSSALERDQLFIAGEIDGMLTDLISSGLFNQDEVRIQIVAQARRAYEDSAQFRILAAPDSGIETTADLQGVAIGISENSVIHYITQRLLEHDGLSVEDQAYIPEPNIPVRFQLLMEGQFQAANLPDPLAQAAIQAGAILVAEDTALAEEQFSQSVLSFSADYIADNPDAMLAFVGAWMQAAEDINADPDAYRELWLEKTNVPDSVKDSYVLPPFPVYDITQELAWNDVMDWMLEQDIIDNAPDYAASINSTFVDALKPAEGDMGDEMSMGDAANGETAFNVNGCANCHTLDGTASAGPSLQGIANHAGETVEGVSAADYLHKSIVNPGAYVVEGFSNIMPAYDTLSDSDVNDLVAYLLTLE